MLHWIRLLSPKAMDNYFAAIQIRAKISSYCYWDEVPGGYTCIESPGGSCEWVFHPPTYTLLCLGDGGGNGSGDPGGGGVGGSGGGGLPPSGGEGRDDPQQLCDPYNPDPLYCPENPNLPCVGDPVKTPQITPTPGSGINGGRWGWTRTNPDGTQKYHGGIDIKAPLNSNVHSMFSGILYSSGFSPTFGNFVIVVSTHNGETIYVLYAHLNSAIPNRIANVDAGEILGLSGNTGNAGNAEPHIHIEVRKQVSEYGFNDAPDYNPENYMSTKFDSNGNPISPINCN